MGYIYTERNHPIDELTTIAKSATKLTDDIILGSQTCFTTVSDLIGKRKECTNNRAYYALAYDLPMLDNLVKKRTPVQRLHQQRLEIVKKHGELAFAYYSKFLNQKTRTCQSCGEKVPMTLSVFHHIKPMHFSHFGLINCPCCHARYGLLSNTQRDKLIRLKARYDQTVEKYVAAYRNACEMLHKQKKIGLRITVGEWVHELDYEDEDY